MKVYHGRISISVDVHFDAEDDEAAQFMLLESSEYWLELILQDDPTADNSRVEMNIIESEEITDALQEDGEEEES